MIVGYGHMVVLIKKQLSEKNRKDIYRSEFKKKKEMYLKSNEGRHSVLEFPTVSTHKLAEIKREIQTNARKKFIANTVIDGVAYIAVMILFFFWLSYITKAL